MVAYGGKNSI